MNQLPPMLLARRLQSRHLHGSTMINSVLWRGASPRYLSCLAAPSSSWSTKRSIHVNAESPHASSFDVPRYNNTALIQHSSCNNLQNKNNEQFTAQRSFSANSSTQRCAIENTPLDGPAGSALLQGLEIHTVPAEDDGHPLAVYTIGNENNDNEEKQKKKRTPVLLLHGRTWSSVPVYHLMGGTNENEQEGKIGENRSLIQALYDNEQMQPYAIDFRGFGGTPKDENGSVEPLRCVSDAVSVLNWIHAKHSSDNEGDDSDCSSTTRPALLGWSHGALIAQITAQRHPDALSKLVLYGSMYNPNIKYSIPPPQACSSYSGHTDHDDFPLHEITSRNEYDFALEDFTGAYEDFTNPGNNEARIHPPNSAKQFAQAALVCDPFKVQWCNLHQLNECHPSLVTVPTMVIAGDDDPYAPTQNQTELFTNLGRGVDRVWSIIAKADHAVHLSDTRHKFVENLNNFLKSE